MIVYSHTLSPRLQYIVQFLSGYFQHPFKLTANEQAYAIAQDFKINYSHQRIDNNQVYITPHILLLKNYRSICFDDTAFPKKPVAWLSKSSVESVV